MAPAPNGRKRRAGCPCYFELEARRRIENGDEGIKPSEEHHAESTTTPAAMSHLTRGVARGAMGEKQRATPRNAVGRGAGNGSGLAGGNAVGSGGGGRRFLPSLSPGSGATVGELNAARRGATEAREEISTGCSRPSVGPTVGVGRRSAMRPGARTTGAPAIDGTAATNVDNGDPFTRSTSAEPPRDFLSSREERQRGAV